MSDTEASGVSSAREPQFKTLCKIKPEVQVDLSRAGKHRIRFEKRDFITSQETVDVNTLLDIITFYVLSTNTLFLFYIKDMNAIGVKLYNLRNILVQKSKVVSVVCKWGHL